MFATLVTWFKGTNSAPQTHINDLATAADTDRESVTVSAVSKHTRNHNVTVDNEQSDKS